MIPASVNVVSSMKATNYERVVEAAVSNATVLDHNISPCEESFIPSVTVCYICHRYNKLYCNEIDNRFSTIIFKGQTFVMYMKMENARDTVTWLQIAKVNCLKHNISL